MQSLREGDLQLRIRVPRERDAFMAATLNCGGYLLPDFRRRLIRDESCGTGTSHGIAPAISAHSSYTVASSMNGVNEFFPRHCDLPIWTTSMVSKP